jgi:hypothetical protein
MESTGKHVPLGQRAHSYWVESRRPLAALVFIAPLLIVYELGVLCFGIQNGADDFMRRFLNLLGFEQHFLLPVLTACILLGWHYLSRQPWRLSGGILPTMAVESLLLGLAVRMIVYVQHVLFAVQAAGGDSFLTIVTNKLGIAIGFLGAGIYEELLFRLILLSLTMWGLRRAGMGPRTSMIAAVAMGGLVFAVAHLVGPAGEPPDFFKFLFRTLAGVFFSLVFLYRGFGIAAGSHAAYDLLVGVF